jgi:hypothetical protein
MVPSDPLQARAMAAKKAKAQRLAQLLQEAHDYAVVVGMDQNFVNTLERMHNEVSRSPMYR